MTAWIYGHEALSGGVEAGISTLLWAGPLPLARMGTQAYVHSAVFAHNLLRLVRLQPS